MESSRNQRVAGRERGAAARHAALAARARSVAASPPTVAFESQGRCIVYGRGESALAAGERLARRLPVSVLLDGPSDDLTAPLRPAATVRRGRIRSVSGHLGAFQVTVDGFAEQRASADGVLRFEEPADGAAAACDILVDLSGGTPLLAGGDHRAGYLRPDPRDPLAVERALFDALGLVGTFDQPRYVALREHLCAHQRNGTVGCTRCLDVCPLGAIAPKGDAVAVDPHVCAGCGGCHAACPTGAIRYADPPPERLHEALAQGVAAWHAAGGAPPLLLLHDPGHGADMLALLERATGGLPETLLPFELNHATLAGPELLFHALAAGVSRVVLLPAPGDAREPLARHAAIAGDVLAALGYGEDRVLLCEAADPLALEAWLDDLAPLAAIPPAGITAAGDARERLGDIFAHLRRHAPVAAERVPLAPGAPFGAVHVEAGCTLCLSCVSVCPTGALADNAESPQLRFRENACVQCGLCVATCPEKVMALEPRLDLTEAAGRHGVLMEEEPFACIVCGKPFGVRRSIEQVITRLAGHPMMADPRMSDRLQMCGDCRVADLAGSGQKNVERPRTTEDWLERAGVDGKRGPSGNKH